jgi:IS30 family transposase
MERVNMPNRELEALKINDIDPMLDRRRKLTPEDRIEISEGYSMGMSIHKLADCFGVSRKTIGFVLFPERVERDKERKKGTWVLYYTTNKRRLYQKRHRAYKRTLLTKQGEK